MSGSPIDDKAANNKPEAHELMPSATRDDRDLKLTAHLHLHTSIRLTPRVIDESGMLVV